MRILISVDMEGIAGIAVTDDVKLGTPHYQRGRHLMTGEASAAVRGALRRSPTADVVVADAHSTATNLIPEELDKRARLIRADPGRRVWSPAWRAVMPPSSSGITAERGL